MSWERVAAEAEVVPEPLPKGAALAALMDDHTIPRAALYRRYGTLFASVSSLGALARCETKGIMQALGWTGPDESLKMRAGQDLHAAVAAARRTYAMGPHVAASATLLAGLRTFHERYDEWAVATIGRMAPSQAERAQAYVPDNLAAILARYIDEAIPKYEYRLDPKLIEVAFALPLDPTWIACGCGTHLPSAGHEHQPAVLLWGRFDALVFDTADDGYVDDLKTSGAYYDASEYENDAQFTLYPWAARHVLPGRRIIGAVVSHLLIRKLPEVVRTASGAIKKCGTHKVGLDECRDLHVSFTQGGPFQREPTAEADQLQTAIRLATRLRALIRSCQTVEDVAREAALDGAYRHECGRCEFRQWCIAGRPTAAETFLTRIDAPAPS